jgi:hypothetical protein
MFNVLLSNKPELECSKENLIHNAGNLSKQRGYDMIISAKECFSVVKDRDYLTIIFLLVFCLSLLGVTFNIFSLRDSGLFLMASILSRLLFIYRAELIFDSLSRRLSERMDAERTKPEFENGNLSLILETEFPKIAKSIKMKCIKKLENEIEVDLSPTGDYTFYLTKVYKQPGKDRRRRQHSEIPR